MDVYSFSMGEVGPDFPAQLIQWFHELARPGTTLCEEYLGVPTVIAPMISISVLIFCPLYLLGVVVFGPYGLGYSGAARWEMSSCVPSMVHGSVSSFVASVYMIRHWRKKGFMDNDTVNQPNEVALMQFSCAYFLEDLFLFILFFAPQEKLFAAHHLLVLAYMKVALFLGYGSISSVVSISMGELTSPLQNIWFWLKHLRYHSKAADEVFAYVSWIYSAFYIFVRSFFGVAVMSHCIYQVIQTRKYPPGLGIFLALMLVGGVLASQTWCFKLSKRLWHPYRRAYGTAPKGPGEHHDSYSPHASSNGTASSSDGKLSANGGNDTTKTPVGSSFPPADKDFSTSLNGKKAL